MKLPRTLTIPRAPDFLIGNPREPYLRRWWVTKRDPKRYRVYLHNILRSDDDRALHDHPASSCSIILRGGYIEHFPGGMSKIRRPGQIIFRHAEQAHRLELRTDKNGKIIPAWTLFIFAPNTREWGFHCIRKKIIGYLENVAGSMPIYDTTVEWVHWRIFTGAPETGEAKGNERGRGCGEL